MTDQDEFWKITLTGRLEDFIDAQVIALVCTKLGQMDYQQKLILLENVKKTPAKQVYPVEP